MATFSGEELRRTPEGRKRLAREQENYRLDILQPKDPLFEKVWGGKQRYFKESREKAEQDSREASIMYRERKQREEEIKHGRGKTVLR